MPLVDYAGAVYDQAGAQDYRFAAYFDVRKELADEWFAQDPDDAPMGYFRAIIRYDSETGQVKELCRKVITRYVPGPIEMTARTRIIIDGFAQTGDRVAHELKNYSSNAEADFVSIENDGTISYMPQSRDIRRVSELLPDDTYDPTGRQFGRPGKIVRKLLRRPGRVSDADVERFANRVKALRLADAGIRLVKGEDIRFWYLEDNYDTMFGGSHRTSCMRYRKTQPYCDLYVHNAESVSMLIYVGETGLLRGRAIVWDMCDENGNPTGYKFMDRIYGDDATISAMQNYSDKQGWWRRSTSGRSYKYLRDNEGKDVLATIFCKLAHPDMRPHYTEYHGYPYCDTMRYVDLQKGIVHNNQTYEHDLQMTYTDGQYVVIHRSEQRWYRWFTGEPPVVPCDGCGQNEQEDCLFDVLGGRYCRRCRDRKFFVCYITGQYYPVEERVSLRVDGATRYIARENAGNTEVCDKCQGLVMAGGRVGVVDGDTVKQLCYLCLDQYGRQCWRCGIWYLTKHTCEVPEEDDLDVEVWDEDEV